MMNIILEMSNKRLTEEQTAKPAHEGRNKGVPPKTLLLLSFLNFLRYMIQVL